MSVATNPERALDRREAAVPSPKPWRRMLWKEARTYQSFFVVLFAFGLFLQLIGQVWPGWDSLSMLMPLMFLAGAIGTGFSREHESNTYIWLRAQPVGPQHVIGSKLMVGAMGAAVMALVFALMLLARYGRYELSVKMTTDLTVAVLELSAWSLLMSLTDRHPLRALVLAGCFAAAIGFGLVLGAEAIYGLDAPRGWSLTWLRLGIASFVMVVALMLSVRWHRHGLTGGGLWGVPSNQAARRVTMRPQPGPMRALVRLTVRQSWWLVFPGALFVLSLGSDAEITASLTLFSGVCGLLTFTTLGRERVQLAVHGVSPARIWLVRMSILALPLAFALMMLAVFRGMLLEQVTWWEVASIVVVVFCANHLVSIRASSSLMAVGLAIAATLCTGLFTNFCWHGGVPVWVLVVPFVVLSCSASLSIIKRWLLAWDDRRTHRIHRCLAWGAVLIWLVGIGVYRWQEHSTLSPEQIAELPKFASIDQASWREQHDKLLELGHKGDWEAFATAALESQVLPDPATCMSYEVYSHAIHELFTHGMNRGVPSDVSLKLLRAQVYWSNRDLYGYSPYRNLLEWAQSDRAADEDLVQLRDELLSHPPSTDTALRKIAWNRNMLHRVAALDPEALAYIGVIHGEAKAIRVFGAMAFWERWRLSRQVDQHALEQARRTRNVSHSIDNHLPISTNVRSWKDTSRLIALAGVMPEMSFALHVREHRANVLRLEAILHFREHGEFPAQIEELEHGADRDLFDPFTAKPFAIDASGTRPWLTSPGSQIGHTGRDYQIALTLEQEDE